MSKNFLTVLLLATALAAGAKVRLPGIIGEHMVLQRNAQAALWGWAAVGAKVTVATGWDGRKYDATAGQDGRWAVRVATPDAGGPYAITFSDGEPLTLRNVMAGEVWICSGQSNMEMPMRGFRSQPVHGAYGELLGAGTWKDRIRIMKVPNVAADAPAAEVGGTWECASPESVWTTSAAAYYFARTLTETLGVPVGIVVSAWGGSRIEAWIDPATAARVEGFNPQAATSPDLKTQLRLGLLYNGMICPIRGYAARGFLWYQGEGNLAGYRIYAQMMEELAALWRRDWDGQDMPFYYVQIAPFGTAGQRATSIPLLVEAQLKAQKTIPFSGIAPTTDVGEEQCIHPARKDVVGSRLAALALVRTYGVAETLPCSEPMPEEFLFGEGEAKVRFKAAVGLHPAYAPILGFELAGSDRVFHQAEAQITKENRNEIVVKCGQVAQPVAIRYAFLNYYPGANLTDTFGLPAFPFRSDTWDDVK